MASSRFSVSLGAARKTAGKKKIVASSHRAFLFFNFSRAVFRQRLQLTERKEEA